MGAVISLLALLVLGYVAGRRVLVEVVLTLIAFALLIGFIAWVIS